MSVASRRALGPQQGAASAACTFFRPTRLRYGFSALVAAPCTRDFGRYSGTGVLMTGRPVFDTVRDDDLFCTKPRWSTTATSASSAAIVLSVPDALSNLFNYSGEMVLSVISSISEKTTTWFTGALLTPARIHMEGIMQAMHDAQAQKNTLREAQRQVEQLEVDISSHENSKYHFCRFIRKRDVKIVALRIRLQEQKQKPRCLGLELDPAVEAATHKVVCDEHVRQLTKENAELTVKMGQLEALLKLRARC